MNWIEGKTARYITLKNPMANFEMSGVLNPLPEDALHATSVLNTKPTPG